MNKWSKSAIAFELLTIVLIILTASDFEIMNTDPDEAFILTGFISLILSLVFSIAGAYKTYHGNTSNADRVASFFVIVSVPILAAITVFTIIRIFAS